MTTYDGRSASYIPGREVVNKEPPVSRYVVEKLYRVHRERVLKVEKTIDSRVVIPDFLLNRDWKKNAERQRQKVILQENQEMFSRLNRLDDAEGHIAKENREHIKRVEIKLDYLRKLKEHGRLVNLVKIQKENEYMLKRLDRAKPQYTMKKCRDWYKHHELFKKGRRSDPTAGHIMHGMKRLLPRNLPPLSSSSTIPSKDSVLDSLTKKSKRSSVGSIDASVRSSSMSMNSSDQSTLRRSSSQGANVSGSIGSHRDSFRQQGGNFSSNRFSQRVGVPRPSLRQPNDMSVLEEKDEGSPMSTVRTADRSSTARSLGLDGTAGDLEGEESVQDQLMRDLEGASSGGEETDSLASLWEDALDGTGSVQGGSVANFSVDDLLLLASRPFPLPTESKNVLVQVYISKEYDEHFYLVVVPPATKKADGSNGDRLAERVLDYDRLFDVVRTYSHHSGQLMHVSEQDDLQTLSTYLTNLFKAADTDGSGSLTFDEFQRLMEQVELGISPQELRFVISEADENENGVVDYEEFVPLAVDLIQSFRARNKAKALNSQEDVLVDDQILQSISADELAQSAKLCLDKLKDYDKKGYGLIRAAEFKRCLAAVAPSAGVRDTEINLMCQLLPRDQFGRLKYGASENNFIDYLMKARFMTMKNAMIESQGSGLQKYLLELCKEEERKNHEEYLKMARNGDVKPTPPGCIPCRSLIQILTTSPRLSLSRLQVLVIMSEASVLDGNINYYQFIPVVTKAIELMFEPKALRQRAELIANTDLSPEALLQGLGMSPEAFEERLLTLFKSYDIDHSGSLDQNEFMACLESLELQLTKGEMVALMATADVAQHGFLGFEDFVKFFSNNLIHLEREKRLRLLQQADSSGTGDAARGRGKGSPRNARPLRASRDYDAAAASAVAKAAQSAVAAAPALPPQPEETALQVTLAAADDGPTLIDLLQERIQQGYDPVQRGVVSYEDFERVLSEIAGDCAVFVSDLLVSEMQHAVRDGSSTVYVNYPAILRTCSALYGPLWVGEINWTAWHEEEERAVAEADAVVDTQFQELRAVTTQLLRRWSRVCGAEQAAEGDAVDQKLAALQVLAQRMTASNWTVEVYEELLALLQAPMIALSKAEALLLLHRLRRRVQAVEVAGPLQVEDVFQALRAARHAAVVRAFLLPISPEVLTGVLVQSFPGVTMRTRMSISSPAHSPTSAGSPGLDDVVVVEVVQCFERWSRAAGVGLSTAQLLFLLSEADAETVATGGQRGQDLHRLAEQVAMVAAQLQGGEAYASRGQVQQFAHIDFRRALGGLRVKSLTHYLLHRLEEEVEKQQVQNAGALTDLPELVLRFLLEMPRVHLQQRDVQLAMAGCAFASVLAELTSADVQDPQALLKARIETLLYTLAGINRERMFYRRMLLLQHLTAMSDVLSGAASAGDEARSPLKAVVERFFNVMKLLPSGSSAGLDDNSSHQNYVSNADGAAEGDDPFGLSLWLPDDAQFDGRATTSHDGSEASSHRNRRKRKHHHKVPRQLRSPEHHRHPSASSQTQTQPQDGLTRIETADDLDPSSSSAAAASAATAGQAEEESWGEDAEVLVLYKGLLQLPVRVIQPVSRAAPGMRLPRTVSSSSVEPSPSARSASSSFVKKLQSAVDSSEAAAAAPTKRAVLLQVVALENCAEMAGCGALGSSLIAQAIAPASDISIPSCVLPLRLPSLGIVDKEAAEQFLLNILDQLVLECRVNASFSPTTASTHQLQKKPSAASNNKQQVANQCHWTLHLVSEEDDYES